MRFERATSEQYNFPLGSYLLPIEQSHKCRSPRHRTFKAEDVLKNSSRNIDIVKQMMGLLRLTCERNGAFERWAINQLLAICH